MSKPMKHRAKRAPDVHTTAEARAAAWEQRVMALARRGAYRTQAFRMATVSEWSRKAEGARTHKRGATG